MIHPEGRHSALTSSALVPAGTWVTPWHQSRVTILIGDFISVLIIDLKKSVRYNSIDYSWYTVLIKNINGYGSRIWCHKGRQQWSFSGEPTIPYLLVGSGKSTAFHSEQPTDQQTNQLLLCPIAVVFAYWSLRTFSNESANQPTSYIVAINLLLVIPGN